MGFVPNLLATIVNFPLLVQPENHTVSGTTTINVGADKKTYIGKVTGTVYSTGYGDIARVLSLNGSIPSDNKLTPLQFPFEANMALKADWNGEGGFTFQGQHQEKVPVTANTFNL